MTERMDTGKGRRFLIIDGYPKESRDQFDDVGMKQAWALYRDMLVTYLPDAKYDLWLSGDDPAGSPTDEELAGYAGILWPGCNLTIYHTEDARVVRHLDLAKRSYGVGVPQFGSCWGLQLAVFVAGGGVEAHPGGREMGIIPNLGLTEEGRRHPMFEGKPDVYSHFFSHDDYVTRLLEGAVRLSGNEYCPIQAATVKHQDGEFWAVQYHPEYDLHEMARLITAREPRLVKQGLFKGHEDLTEYVEKLELIAADPGRKDLRWQLKIDEHVLDPAIRQREFINWLKVQVLAT